MLLNQRGSRAGRAARARRSATSSAWPRRTRRSPATCCAQNWSRPTAWSTPSSTWPSPARATSSTSASIDLAASTRSASAGTGRSAPARTGEPQTEIAKKNLAIIMKRFEKVQEIRRYLDVARGELDLIENSFRLLADQIVTMQSPHELSGQLDELLDGVRGHQRQRGRHRERCWAASAWPPTRETAHVRHSPASPLGRRPAPPLPARRSLDVRPARQRLRHRRARAADARPHRVPDRRAAEGLARDASRSTTSPAACASPSARRAPATSTSAARRPQKDKVLPALERLLVGSMRTAVIVEYAESIAPAGDPTFHADADRAAIITLHRWSSLPAIEKGDNIILLIAENLTELAPKIVSNPEGRRGRRPDARPRPRAGRGAPRRPAPDATRTPIATPRSPRASRPSRSPRSWRRRRRPRTRPREREAFIAGILGPGPDVAERAKKLAALTAGLAQDEIRRLSPRRVSDRGRRGRRAADRARADVDRLIAKRKREILERECFGLVEFVEPEHGFEVVGGMDEVKKDLLVLAENIREGRTSRVPMGILFTGPMGTGKTFVAEAFAKECGLTTIKLKNFRSKWVGATEGNLEKILTRHQGHRPGGRHHRRGRPRVRQHRRRRRRRHLARASSRASRSSCPTRRTAGRILFLVMTNRPDKLDVDLKRAGRLDRKIPFLYSQTPEEVEKVARAVVAQEQAAHDRRLRRDPRRRSPRSSSATATPTSRRSS